MEVDRILCSNAGAGVGSHSCQGCCVQGSKAWEHYGWSSRFPESYRPWFREESSFHQTRFQWSNESLQQDIHSLWNSRLVVKYIVIIFNITSIWMLIGRVSFAGADFQSWPQSRLRCVGVGCYHLRDANDRDSIRAKASRQCDWVIHQYCNGEEEWPGAFLEAQPAVQVPARGSQLSHQLALEGGSCRVIILYIFYIQYACFWHCGNLP